MYLVVRLEKNFVDSGYHSAIRRNCHIY